MRAAALTAVCSLSCTLVGQKKSHRPAGPSGRMSCGFGRGPCGGRRTFVSELRFTADGPEQTTVELERRHRDRLVDGQALRTGITGGSGRSSLLELFAKAATNQT